MYLLASNASSGMFAAGMLIMIFFLVRRSRRYLGKSTKEKATPRRKLDAARQATPLLDAPPEILRWHVEMHDMARDLKAELDSKMSALQAIIGIASEQSVRLEAAIARAEQLGISTCPDTLAAIEALNSSNEDAASHLDMESFPSSPDEIATRRTTVYQLADRGLGANAIARSIGAPLGDVELLMSLRSNATADNAR